MMEIVFYLLFGLIAMVFIIPIASWLYMNIRKIK